MATDLKRENAAALSTILLATFASVALIEVGLGWLLNNAGELSEIGIVALGTVLAGLLANIVPARLKHAIVFAGHRYALPGHRCNRLCARDARIDLSLATERWPRLFSEQMPDSERNPIWYREIYKPIKDDPVVRQGHRAFLLYRDAAAGVTLLFLAALIFQLCSNWIPAWGVSIWSLSFLFAEDLALLTAARIAGNRMTVNAVALALD
ncbi:hypothetical protein J7355_16290 [Endozoicomonas sp. G2_2]|uniref:hypothetical protein n=1 Tax=Endozoicomonas sp. G2_2 TaxID=2821092 RepID=UPI001ADB99BF|nr:hypothetical protein [Endozoicomonas sp. G2_2]MBO9471650.1 hypothetical protein [Endozoicomonas sp. G2_2]